MHPDGKTQQHRNAYLVTAYYENIPHVIPDFPDPTGKQFTVCLCFREGFKRKKQRTQMFSTPDSGRWAQSHNEGQGCSSGLQLDRRAAAHDLPWTPRPAARHQAQGHSRGQLCLRAETGLTFNPEPCDCLAPLPLVCFCP